MTQKDKDLLLKDLCARLPYGVRLHFNYMKNTIVEYATIEDITKLKNGDYSFHIFDRDINDNPLSSTYIKFGERFVRQYIPYLRPMSSMTEEEREELSDYLCERVMSDKSGITFPPDPIHGKGIPFEWMSSCIDWLNEHHFDYCGLIENGLALEAKEGFYKIKK